MTKILMEKQVFSSLLCEPYVSVLQGPPSIVIALFFRKRWLFLIKHAWRCRHLWVRLCMLGFCAEVPTLGWYFFFKTYEHITIPLWFGFFVTALLLFSLVLCNRLVTSQKISISALQATGIGFVQGLALLPGISRLASTYTMGRWFGLTPSVSFLFSWTIEWPLLAATFIKGTLEYPLAIFFPYKALGVFIMGIAILLAYALLCVVYAMTLKNTLWYFGFYMFLPIIAALILC